MQGNMLLELSYKAKAYTDGYKSPFDQGQGNDPSTILTDLQHAEHREFAPLFAEIGFKNPEDSDSRAKKPKPDDPDYAIKLALHNAFCLERDVWTELKAIRKDFSTVVAAVSQAYGPDFFGYVQKHWENLDIRRLYKINTPEGYTLFDSSLRERWNAPLVLAAIDKQFKSMGVGSFTSTFGKKAHSDLIAYEALRAKRAKEVDELYTRPFEDLVVEEFISNLPVPTIEEVDVPMEQAGGSADAAPADSSFEEMAGVEEAKQEPDSAAPMDVPECSQGVLWTLSVPKTSFWVNSLVCIDDSRIPGVYENGGIHVCKLVVSWDYTGQWTPRCDEFLEMGAMLCMAKYKSAVPLLCVLFIDPTSSHSQFWLKREEDSKIIIVYFGSSKYTGRKYRKNLSLLSLCTLNPPCVLSHIHACIYLYVYIYIYMCVCV